MIFSCLEDVPTSETSELQVAYTVYKMEYISVSVYLKR